MEYYEKHGKKGFSNLNPEEAKEKERLEKEAKEARLIDTLDKADEALRDVDASIIVELVKIGVNLTPNQSERAIEVGMEDYKLKVTKRRQDMLINAGGFTAGSFFSLRKLYDFAINDLLKLKQTLSELKSEQEKGDYKEFLTQNRNMKNYK